MWSVQLGSIHLAFFTHTYRGTQNACFMHLSPSYTSYFAFLGRRTASNLSTASMLSHWFPILPELFWHRANYTSTASRGLWPRPFFPIPLTHTLPFCCSFVFCIYFFFTCFPFSYLGMQNVCVSVCWERWWIIHVVVSWSVRQTVETVNCPSGPFSPTAHCS